jgi:hypothetical protein
MAPALVRSSQQAVIVQNAMSDHGQAVNNRFVELVGSHGTIFPPPQKSDLSNAKRRYGLPFLLTSQSWRFRAQQNPRADPFVCSFHFSLGGAKNLIKTQASVLRCRLYEINEGGGKRPL